ncbi:UDP-3-O-[3-hydroxymyristoyl] N-acetylglucosamine deacetylase [Roseovarius sp. MBR-154]
MQRTIKFPLIFEGVGLHGGRQARMVLRPAAPGTGILFRRTDPGTAASVIPALWHRVAPSALCTRLTNAEGASVSTVEHLMAALAGCGIHNVMVDIDGPELPILDGSATPFVEKILAAGTQVSAEPLRVMRLRRPVHVARGEARASLSPAPTLRIEFDIAFADTAIGVQRKSLDMSNGSFVRELSNCRTFCRRADISTMHANGLALGGSFDNAVVVDDDRVLTPGGLRHWDEAVRHKMLDAMGDLGLAGVAILGHYRGHLAGHALTAALLRAVFADPSNYEIATCDSRTAAGLPGAGLYSESLARAA